jgi:hypothetical protein
VDYTYDGALRSLDQSYHRLGLNRIDVVLIHDVDVWTHGASGYAKHFRTAMDGAYRALEELRRAGSISAIGVGVNEIEPCPKYKSIQFIDTLYANDDPDKSYSIATSAMQAHPDVKLFISGLGISNPVINKAIEDTNPIGQVFATGFALPSTMKTYLDRGTCKQYALWSPFKFGYMATYFGILIKSGKITPKPGTEVDMPGIGKRTIEEGGIANLNSMLFFTKGHDDFETAIPMS